MTFEIQNAVIKSVTLSNEDHGCLSAWLHLDYGCSGQGFGCSGQGFGGFMLWNPCHKTDATGLFVWRCMEISGVTEWSALKGRSLRVRSDHNGVEAIGHFLRDEWFCPREEFKKFEL